MSELYQWYRDVVNTLGERELKLWFPVWEGLLTLVGGDAPDEEQLALCMTARGPVQVTAGLVRVAGAVLKEEQG